MLAAEQILANATLSEAERQHRRMRELAELVAGLANADALPARTDALVALALWVVRPDPRIPAPAGGGVTRSTAGADCPAGPDGVPACSRST